VPVLGGRRAADRNGFPVQDFGSLGRHLHRDDGRKQPHAHGYDAVDPEASAARTTIGFFIALIVGVLVPAINFYALLIILLTVPLQRVYDRRSAAARLAPAAQ
jgi:hypothetical protein